MCKSCRKDYDAQFWKKKASEYAPRKVQARQAYVMWLRTLKEGRLCTDCGKSFHYAAMQWDHLPGHVKELTIAEAPTRRYSRARVLAEIEKCELVCANCHAVRTHNRRA